MGAEWRRVDIKELHTSRVFNFFLKEEVLKVLSKDNHKANT